MAVRARAEPLTARPGAEAEVPTPRPPPVREYLDHLRVERGLSPNSLVAYAHDLDRLSRWAARRRRAVVALRQADLSEVWGLAWFGGAFTPECVAAAPRLRAVGGITDNSGYGLPVAALAAREIPFIDATRAWAQSVAEVALGLALGALRQIPQWHGRMAGGEPLWQYPYAQFCDNPEFVNGDLGTKH